MKNYILPSLNISPANEKYHIDPSQILKAIESVKGEAYYSVFNFEQGQAPYGKLSPALGFFVLDFDSEDISKAKEETIKVWEHLKLTPDHARIFFSGNKGFHLYLHESLLNFLASPVLNTKVKSWAIKLKRELNLETLDMKVFAPAQKMRLPRSKHPKSGLFKQELGIDDLRLRTVDELRAFAKVPSYTTLGSVVPATEPLVQDSHTVSDDLPIFGTENLLVEEHKPFTETLCVAKMWNTKFPTGKRHAAYLILIQDSFDKQMPEYELTEKLARWITLNDLEGAREEHVYRRVREVYHEGQSTKEGCYESLKYAFCSAHCKLFSKLDPKKRATPSDLNDIINNTGTSATVNLDELEELLQRAENEEKRPKSVSSEDMEKNPKKAEKKLRNYLKFPDFGDKTPLATAANLKHLMDIYKIKAHYDIIRKDIEFTIPNGIFLKDTSKNDKLTHLVSLALKHRIPRGNIEDYASYIATRNPYNPVAQWVHSKPWDNISRIQYFYDTIKCVGDNSFKELLIRKWMVSAIAAAMSPNGAPGSGVLVFKGAQYLGKTNWFKNLVPKELELTKEGMMLDPKDKDSVYQCVTHWLVELGELDATFRKADIAQLKAFLTKDKDMIRLPYKREPSEFARRTVFFASVNQNDYLNDPTGNRRFWTIDCESINHSHGLDMQQIWAEVYSIWKQGETHFLTNEEVIKLNEHNSSYQNVDPFEELIELRFEYDTDTTPIKAIEIFHALNINNPSPRDMSRMRMVLEKMGIKLERPRSEDIRIRGYKLKLKPSKDIKTDHEIITGKQQF